MISSEDVIPDNPEQATFWIDLDNSPHVPFFAPIINKLEARGYRVWVTASQRHQVTELAAMHGIPHSVINGGYFGKNKLLKVIGILGRAFLLLTLARKKMPFIALSHGSRSQIVAAKIAGIPVVVIVDYEFVKFPFLRCDNVIIPQVIPDSAISPSNYVRLWKYQGIKEDVYVPLFEPTGDVLDELGIDSSRIIVTVRPPATEAHYHTRISEEIFRHTMDHLSANPDTVMVMLPRNQKQEQAVKDLWPDLTQEKRIIIPKRAVLGLNLIWQSDLVISGGGTMNREAAALGIPVYSIFSGEIGHVDRYLSANNRLTLVRSIEEVDRLIKLVKRHRHHSPRACSKKALHDLVDHLETVLMEQTQHSGLPHRDRVAMAKTN